MNTARGIFGAVLAAGALATIATFHHQFWPSVQSPPQPIEATRKADSLTRPESVTQEFADLPKSVRTVPVTRQAAPSPTPPAPVQQAIAVAPTPPPPQLAMPPIRPFPQRCPRMLNPSTSARAMAAIASTSCAGIMRCGVATIRGIGEGKTVAPKR